MHETSSITHPPSPSSLQRSQWLRHHLLLMRLTDFVAITVAVLSAQFWRFGLKRESLYVGESLASYWLVSLALIALWWVFLETWGSRDPRILGTGFEEYKHVFISSAWLFGLIAVLSYLLRVETSRGFVGVAFPVGLVLLFTGRLLCRRKLTTARRDGNASYRVLLLGSPGAVLHLSQTLSSHAQAGYFPAAAYLPAYSLTSPSQEELPLPVAGTDPSVTQILQAIDDYAIEAVAISSTAALSPRSIRRLGWELSDRRIRLIMAPALTDVAGPRIHTQPLAGLPLIHVSTPRLSGINALLKRSFDLVIASLACILTFPITLVTAIMIRWESEGPILFRQVRVGKDGNTFSMYKFRSMVQDAEERLEQLQSQSENTGNEVLFKLKEDPRITKVGRFIRQYSIDELPQLLNVLKGEMSLVGPRPPLPDEVERYEEHVHRRLLVQPGITGLWQVSGRSDLSWDETVRFDLYYVENWSLLQDMLILMRTFRAVLARQGAY